MADAIRHAYLETALSSYRAVKDLEARALKWRKKLAQDLRVLSSDEKGQFEAGRIKIDKELRK